METQLSISPQNKVTFIAPRHSGMFLAGIQKCFLDTGIRRYDEQKPDTYLCGAVLTTSKASGRSFLSGDGK